MKRETRLQRARRLMDGYDVKHRCHDEVPGDPWCPDNYGARGGTAEPLHQWPHLVAASLALYGMPAREPRKKGRTR